MGGAVKVLHVGGDENGDLNGEFVKVGMKVMGFRGGLCVWLVCVNGKELVLREPNSTLQSGWQLWWRLAVTATRCSGRAWSAVAGTGLASMVGW
ncbi:hypothetical protein V6N11_036536 [Hibiscus sabdariffa]|uniref:Uncharacterized protein n=1 Tax=Hibiscus sabdariffa TaxID=183260 RepID=A0ABR2RAN8_9ROSI